MNASETVRESVDLVLGELSHAASIVAWDEWEELPGLILRAPSIFAIGNGRSGLALRMAAMRLMHFGRTVHVVGETTTPAIREGDLLLAVSGSGSTNGVVYAAEEGMKRGAVVVAITTNASSALAHAASHVLLVPGAEKTDNSGQLSKQYAGTLFEQMTLVLLDAVFHTLWQRSGIAADELYKHHSNLG